MRSVGYFYVGISLLSPKALRRAHFHWTCDVGIVATTWCFAWFGFEAIRFVARSDTINTVGADSAATMAVVQLDLDRRLSGSGRSSVFFVCFVFERIMWPGRTYLFPGGGAPPGPGGGWGFLCGGGVSQ